MTTLLIDADMICYQSSVAVEKDVPWDSRHHYLFSSMEDAKGVFYSNLHELKEQSGTDDLVFCFSDPEVNFRKSLPGIEYKANRTSRKPLCYWALKAYIEEMYATVMFPNLEADDVMGILQTSGSDYIADDTVIWTLDKDLKQIPGAHLIDDEIIEISEREGELFHMYQTVVGDVTDGYFGCPGFGDRKALKLLSSTTKLSKTYHELKRGPRKGETEIRWVEEPASDLWEIVVSCYESVGLTEEDAIKQARLAKILDANHYTNGEINLWTPN